MNTEEELMYLNGNKRTEENQIFQQQEILKTGFGSPKIWVELVDSLMTKKTRIYPKKECYCSKRGSYFPENSLNWLEINCCQRKKRKEN